MSNSFVPLVPASSASSAPAAARNPQTPASNRVTVVDPAKIKFTPIQAAAGPASHAHASSTPDLAPEVRIKKEGERIVGFQILCSCGQVFDFACVY